MDEDSVLASPAVPGGDPAPAEAAPPLSFTSPFFDILKASVRSVSVRVLEPMLTLAV